MNRFTIALSFPGFRDIPASDEMMLKSISNIILLTHHRDDRNNILAPDDLYTYVINTIDYH
jgi:hypothetical protein